MTQRARLDIRLPLGGLFGLLGVLLTTYGAVSPVAGAWVNVNLWWGIVMIAFGASMLFASRRAARE